MILPYCPAISEQRGCNRRRLRAQERRELLHCRVPVVSMASAWQDSSTAFVRVWTLDPRRGSTAFPFLSISACQLLTAPKLKRYFSKSKLLPLEGMQGLQNGHQKGPPQPIPRDHTSLALPWHSGLTEFPDSSEHLRSS